MTPLIIGGAVLGLILMAGILAGQFRRGVVSELRDALESARTEIELANGRADRLEKQVQFMEQRLHELEARPDWSQVVAVVRESETNIISAVKQSQIDMLNIK